MQKQDKNNRLILFFQSCKEQHHSLHQVKVAGDFYTLLPIEMNKLKKKKKAPLFLKHQKILKTTRNT